MSIFEPYRMRIFWERKNLRNQAFKSDCLRLSSYWIVFNSQNKTDSFDCETETKFIPKINFLIF